MLHFSRQKIGLGCYQPRPNQPSPNQPSPNLEAYLVIFWAGASSSCPGLARDLVDFFLKIDYLLNWKLVMRSRSMRWVPGVAGFD